ncbi:MAG: glycoside hydrolase family 5 protein [Oscillospiraceae bacterium]|jgi:endoglucanase|nr:glycoside hydrolase family 5 protein [Oscillospiraceae bacterium]
MKIIVLFLALILLAASCAPSVQPSEENPSPSPVIIPWEGKPSPKPVEPSPIPSPIGFENIPVPDVTRLEIPDTEPMRFAMAMAPGWNLGNTLDATGGAGLANETSWGNPKTTQEIIDAVKEAGFNSIRIPVTWHKHVDGDLSISAEWMDRVQEVVDYAYRIELTVIINIHHDDHKDYVYPDSEHYESSSRYVKRIWEQVAERFKEYGERLVFEGLNEPRLKGHRFEWWQDWNSEECVDALDVLCRLQQDFVDTVRASGGNNGTRYLMVCGLGANFDSVTHDLYRLPEDTAEDRILISVHAYTPFSFALQSSSENGSVSEFDMTENRSTRDIDHFMDRLHTKYITNGIPVVIGEYGARDKGGNLRSRVEFAAYYTAAAAARGMPCIWWDNGGFSGGGENFGLLERRGMIWMYPDIVAALVTYAK